MIRVFIYPPSWAKELSNTRIQTPRTRISPKSTQILTPICPHTLWSRIFTVYASLSIRWQKTQHTIPILEMVKVLISPGPLPTQLHRFMRTNRFYQSVLSPFALTHSERRPFPRRSRWWYSPKTPSRAASPSPPSAWSRSTGRPRLLLSSRFPPNESSCSSTCMTGLGCCLNLFCFLFSCPLSLLGKHLR